ncbi:MAG TPA: pseudoazurin [Rhodopila sp.]|nr:pseudoazurin [Rhodopila sp.]
MIRSIAGGLLCAAISMGVAHAASVDVKVLNKGTHGGMMVFEPSLVRIAPGDTVHFVAADKGHNVESIPGMAPDGATPFSGKMNQDLTVTFDKPGVYGVRCKPHYGMGMVAMVVVGDPVNEDAAKAITQPGKAKQVFGELFTQLDSTKAAAK